MKTVSAIIPEALQPEGPLFVSLLVANGWFIAPKTFPVIGGGPSATRRAKWAILRIPVFIAAWVIGEK